MTHHRPLSRLAALCPMLLLACVATLAGCSPITFTIGGNPADAYVESRVVREPESATRDQVAVIDVAGLIQNGERRALLGAGENPVSLLAEKLQAAREDDDVKAVILRINSPGGTVGATEAMYREVLRFRKDSGKPVVAVIMDVGASGGYYLACAADRIVSYPTSVVGSIGVIVQLVNVKDALGRIGVTTEAIVSAENKDIGSPLGRLTDEERQILQTLVDDFYGQFVSVVKQRRPDLDAARIAELTDGRVMSGQRAVKAGLVDQVGDLYDGFSLAKTMADIDDAGLVVYRRPYEFAGSPYAQSPVGTTGGVQVNLAQINLSESSLLTGVGIYYLWQP